MSENSENIQNQMEVKQNLEDVISYLGNRKSLTEDYYQELTGKLTENIKKFDEYWKEEENDLNLEVVGELEVKNKRMIENLSQTENDPNALKYLHDIILTQCNFLLKNI